MEKINELRNDVYHLRKALNAKERILNNYNSCEQMCKQNNDYKLCLHDETATCYAIATLTIYLPECSSIPDHTDIIRFKEYVENNEVKPMYGLIPNFTYKIGNQEQFMQSHVLHDGQYYVIPLHIPFVLVV